MIITTKTTNINQLVLNSSEFNVCLCVVTNSAGMKSRKEKKMF